MIKIYGMETCSDCTYVEEQVKGNNQYEVIDIGQHVRDLKAFLRLRDHHPAFNEAKSVGAVGIPCFILEDGTVTLNPEDAGLRSHVLLMKEQHVILTEAVVDYVTENTFPSWFLCIRYMYPSSCLERIFQR